jgi:tripeptide aminopeptidase
VVPESCWLKGEARSHSLPALRRQTQHMLACLHQAAAEAGGALEAEIEREFDPFRAPLNSRPVKLAKAAAKKIGLPFSAGSSGGGADTSHFAAAGIPCITLAAGYENPHSSEEQIALEELRRLGEYTLALVLQA